MAGPTEYQWVITSTNYDSDPKFPRWLRFDGIDDYLNLPYMGLYANGSASAICAVSVRNIASDILTEGNALNSTPFYRPVRQNDAQYKNIAYRDDSAAQAVAGSLLSPADGLSRVTSCVDTGSSFFLRGSGNASSTIPYTRGITTLSNTTIGALSRTTVSGFSAMDLYGLIITKSALTDAQRVRCERFLARKAGVML